MCILWPEGRWIRRTLLLGILVSQYIYILRDEDSKQQGVNYILADAYTHTHTFTHNRSGAFWECTKVCRLGLHQLPGNTIMCSTSNVYSDHYVSFIGLRLHEKKGSGYFRSPSLKREERFHLKPRPYTYAQSVLTSIVSWPTSLYTHTQTHRRKDAQTHCPVRIMCLLLLSRMEGGKSTVVYQPQEKLYRKPSSVERSEAAGQNMH